MKLTIKKQIGKTPYHFQVEGNNLQELLQESKKLNFPDIKECGLCNSTNLILDYHVAAKKYKYSHVTCLDCRSTLNFSQQTENPDIFYLAKNKKWNEIKLGQEQEQEQEQDIL